MKRGGKARCVLSFDDLAAHGEGMVAVLVPDEADDDPAPPVFRGARRKTGGRAKPGKIQTALLGSFHPASTTVIRYRAKGALRDVGKALGLPEDLTKTLSSQVWGWSEDIDEKHAASINLNLKDRRLRLALDLAGQLVGFPRHLSQHPGGFVLTRDRLDELVPIEPAAMADRQVIEWDKDDIDALSS